MPCRTPETTWSSHVHGPSLSDDERAHRRELEQLVGELGLEGRVDDRRRAAASRDPALFATHDALVNNMRAGAPDKVVYEAAPACLPVLASNPVFDAFLDENSASRARIPES